jgi:hypothetical protein
MRMFERWYFWLVLKLEISYRVMISWRILVSCFVNFIFLHVEIFEFPLFFFCLQILFNGNWQGHSVTHPLYLVCYQGEGTLPPCEPRAEAQGPGRKALTCPYTKNLHHFLCLLIVRIVIVNEYVIDWLNCIQF